MACLRKLASGFSAVFSAKGYSPSSRSQRIETRVDREPGIRTRQIYCAILPGGTDADRPTLAGGRCTLGPLGAGRGGGWICRGGGGGGGAPKPNRLRMAGGGPRSG